MHALQTKYLSFACIAPMIPGSTPSTPPSLHDGTISAGGGSGKRGEQFHVSSSGRITRLNGMDGLTVEPGDKIVIKTPGGGGWGNKKP